MNNKKGFTLAEILISLTILGVLAAILFPLLHKYSPDKNKIMFRKGYYTIEKSVSQLANDETHYPSGTTWSGGSCSLSGVSTECLFHNTTLTADITAGKDKFCYLLSDLLNTIGTIDCTSTNLAKTNITTWNFKTTDGIKWRLVYNSTTDPFNLSNTTQNAWIVIDVNGDNEPNCLNPSSGLATVWSTQTKCAATFDKNSIDRHGLMIRYDGKIVLDNNDILETNALSDPTKFTK